MAPASLTSVDYFLSLYPGNINWYQALQHGERMAMVLRFLNVQEARDLLSSLRAGTLSVRMCGEGKLRSQPLVQALEISETTETKRNHTVAEPHGPVPATEDTCTPTCCICLLH